MKKLFKTLALVSFAIVGMVVSSCTVEDIKTIFTPKNAEAEITVLVLDIVNGKDVTTEAKLSTNINDKNVKVESGKITVTGDPDIKQMSFKAFAQYSNYKSGEITVEIPSVLAGGKYSATKIIPVGDIAKGYEIGEPVEPQKTQETVGTFYPMDHTVPSYKHAYGHGRGDGKWLYNETEFLLNTEVIYPLLFEIKVGEIEFTEKATSKDKETLNEKYQLLSPLFNIKTELTDTLEIQVSAYAMYSAYAVRTTVSATIPVLRVNSDDSTDTVAKVSVEMTEGTQAEYCEAPLPEYSHLYIHGHGQPDEHGQHSSNAGGGIMWTE